MRETARAGVATLALFTVTAVGVPAAAAALPSHAPTSSVSLVAPDPGPRFGAGACGGRTMSVTCRAPVAAGVPVAAPPGAERALAAELGVPASGSRSVAAAVSVPHAAQRALRSETTPAGVVPSMDAGAQRAGARARQHAAVTAARTSPAPRAARAALLDDLGRQ